MLGRHEEQWARCGRQQVKLRRAHGAWRRLLHAPRRSSTRQSLPSAAGEGCLSGIYRRRMMTWTWPEHSGITLWCIDRTPLALSTELWRVLIICVGLTLIGERREIVAHYERVRVKIQHQRTIVTEGLPHEHFPLIPSARVFATHSKTAASLHSNTKYRHVPVPVMGRGSRRGEVVLLLCHKGQQQIKQCAEDSRGDLKYNYD
jgi:hypothetical protein